MKRNDEAQGLIGWNVYGGRGFIEFVPVHRLPVDPQGWPAQPRNERETRIFLANEERRHHRERYCILRAAFEAKACSAEDLAAAAERRVQTCVDYIRSYVEESVRPDLVNQHLSNSTEVCARSAAREALVRVAEQHSDQLLCWLAEHGDWGISLFAGHRVVEAVVLPQGLPADAPEHPGFF